MFDSRVLHQAERSLRRKPAAAASGTATRGVEHVTEPRTARPEDKSGRSEVSAAALAALQAAFGNQAAQRLVHASAPGTTAVQRIVTLFDERGRPYPNRVPKNATAEEVLTWVMNFMGESDHDDLAKDKELLQKLCDDPTVTLSLSAAKRGHDASFREFLAAFEKFRKSGTTTSITSEPSITLEPIAENDQPQSELDVGSEASTTSSSVGLTLVGGASVSDTALQLEAFLNHCLRQVGKPNEGGLGKPKVKSTFIKPRELPICQMLNVLTASLTDFEVDSYPILLQIIRLKRTFEFDLLLGVTSGITGCIKKLDKAIGVAQEEMESEGVGEPDSKASLIYDEIGYAIDMSRPQFLELLFKSDIKVGRHGKTKTSASATWQQQEPALGELVLCAPMIKQIHDIAVTHMEVYEWSTVGLVTKILQGTVRRFKVATILDCVSRLDALMPDLLRCAYAGQISANAFGSIHSKLTQYVPNATAYSGKGQVRILETLCQLLTIDNQLKCVGYEDKGDGDVPADIILSGHGEHPDDRLIIEVEHIPEGIRKAGTAYEYLCGRYAHKMSTIGDKLMQLNTHYKLVLMAPAGTQLLANDIDRLEADGRFL